MANSSEEPAKATRIAPQDVPVTNPDNIRAVYSNFFGMSATVTDFTIIFLELGQSPGSTPPQKNEVKAMVTLPMAAAAGLKQVLEQLVAQVEEANRQAQKAAASVKKN